MGTCARMDVEKALEELVRVACAHGVAAPDAPSDLTALLELEAEIAPMTIPADMRRLWELIDFQTLRVEPYPGLHGPEFALESWRLGRDEFPAAQPLALLQVAYEGQQCMSVELDMADFAGGALFEWYVVDGGFERRFNRIADWLMEIRWLIEAGTARRVEYKTGPRLLVPDPDLGQDARTRPPSPRPHPFYGDVTHIGRDILEWPRHWQRSSGLRPEDVALRGATDTIANLLATPPTQEVRATILAKVVSLATSGGRDRVRIDDGTGTLDVHCEGRATLLGPRLGDWFEFDVVIAPGPRIVPPDPTRAAADAAARGGGEVERLAAILHARHGGPAGAVAEAVRRAPH